MTGFINISKSASADTDYRCFNECVKSKVSKKCFQECDYNETSLTTKKKLAAKEFSELTPVNDKVVIFPQKNKKTKPVNMDYDCVRECQKEGWQYQHCNEKCVKKDEIKLLN